MVGTTRLVAKITNNNGRLSTAAPVTLKNQVQEIRSIEDIFDVSEVEVSAGATLVYNPENDKYEVRKLQSEDIGGLTLDGGTF